MQSNNVASFLHNSPSSRVSFLPSPTTNFNISFPFIRVTNSPVLMSSRTFAPYVWKPSPLIIRRTVSHLPPSTKTRESSNRCRPMTARTTTSSSPFPDYNSSDGHSSTLLSPFISSPISIAQTRHLRISTSTAAPRLVTRRLSRVSTPVTTASITHLSSFMTTPVTRTHTYFFGLDTKSELSSFFIYKYDVFYRTLPSRPHLLWGSHHLGMWQPRLQEDHLQPVTAKCHQHQEGITHPLDWTSMSGYGVI